MARDMFTLCALVLAVQAARGQEIVDPADLTAGLQGPGGQTQVRYFTLELLCATLAQGSGTHFRAGLVVPTEDLVA
jgi:hypothetical protein